MSSDDECLSPLMSLRPLKNSILLRTPLRTKIGISTPDRETPISSNSTQHLDSFKTPDSASCKKVTAAFLFSSCKKNRKLEKSTHLTVLVGDSSDDEEQFQDSVSYVGQERNTSCAVEDSITEYSLIRKWLLNTEDSFTSSESELEFKQDVLHNQTGSKSTPQVQHLLDRTSGCRTNEESVILLSSGEEDAGLDLKLDLTRSNKPFTRSSTMLDKEGNRLPFHGTFLNDFPAIKTSGGICRRSYTKEVELFAPNSSEDESILSSPMLPETSTDKIPDTPEKGESSSRENLLKSNMVSKLIFSESQISPKNKANLQSYLIDSSLQSKHSNRPVTTSTSSNAPLSRAIADTKLSENDFLLESSNDEENLMPLKTKLSTWRNQQQAREYEQNDEETTASRKPDSKENVMWRNNQTPIGVPTTRRYEVEVESDLEDLFVSLTVTEDPPNHKPKKTPKARRKKKTTVDSVNDVKRYEGKHSTFLSSLSENFPQELRHPEATPFLRTFRKTKDELTRRLFYLYNEAVFDNMLQSDFSITWNNRLTRTAGYCRHFTRREDGVTFFESRIELSSKVVDTPCRLRDTLVHELCHAATWTIDNCRGGHGPMWRKWANRALKAFPELPPITRCHNYEIAYKYYYNCMVCSFSTGRHSKSVDIKTHVCPMCRGRLELSKEPKNSSSSTAATSGTLAAPKTPRTPNAFALFVKEHYAAVKASRSEMPHAAVMKVLSAKFAESKKQYS